jgi:serine/threonine protein kinase
MHHINQEGFVYRDLALRNILLDKAGEPTEQRAVLADLGWMVKKGPDGVAHESISSAPWRIMAPETMGEQQAFSEKSDVWSCVLFCTVQYTGDGRLLHITKLLTTGLAC